MAQKKIEEVTDDFWENQVDSENKMLIEDFLLQERLSDATLKQYRSALKIFAKWVHDHCRTKSGAKIYELKARDALRYQDWLSRKGLSPSAIRFKRSAVSSLCGYIEVYWSDEYPSFRNIYSKAIKPIKNTKVKEKDPLTMKEVEKLAKELAKREEWQKLAYLWFTYITGCRREESRQLLKEVAEYKKATDKNGKKKKFYITHPIRAKGEGKTGKVRTFKFDERAMKAIQKWLEYRKTLVDEDDCEYVFVSKSDGKFRQLSRNTFNHWCGQFSDILGGKHVHPHLLRSSRATNAKEQGVDIKSIQKMLGHNSSETTEIYIIRNDEDEDDDLY
jgi:site-specific recombinase XerD